MRLSLGRTAVLSGVIGAAVASVLAQGCGGDVRAAAREDDARVPGDGSPADAPVRCSFDAGVVSTTIFAELDGSGRPPLWQTSYSVDPTCCEPQLEVVVGYAADAGIGQGCGYIVEVPCGAAEVDAGAECQGWCNSALGTARGGQWECGNNDIIGFDAGPAPSVFCTDTQGCGNGRPPRGFVPRPVFGPSALGRELARMAQVEAASVVAFEALHADLARLGAPRSLLRSVRAAGRDEVRHARRVGREAERLGVAVPLAVVAPIEPRSIERLAIDNAEEGCVRETFGAALNALQAERATDRRLRALMRSLAADELRHAALSWRVAEWLETKLDAAGRARIEEARRSSIAALERELSGPVPANAALGTPDGDGQRRLLATMRAAMGSSGDERRAA